MVRQLKWSARAAVTGAKGGGQAAGQGDDGEGADAVRSPPAGDGGEGGLVEGGRHRGAGQEPGGVEDRHVGGSGDGQDGGHGEYRAECHDLVWATPVEDAADRNASGSGDQQGRGEGAGRGGR